MFFNGTNKRKPLNIRKQPSKLNPHPPRNSGSPNLQHVLENDNGSRRSKSATAQTEESLANDIDQRKRRREEPQSRALLGSGAESDSDKTVNNVRKRPKLEESLQDLDRRICCKEAFETQPGTSTSVVHAADIPILDKATRYESLIPGLSDPIHLKLQYPSAEASERYRLVKPIHDPHAFQALSDIVEVMHQVADHYLPDGVRSSFTNESTGFPQRLQRAANKKSAQDIVCVIKEYNNALANLRTDGTIMTVLNGWQSVAPALVERILNQTYSRTVSPNLRKLRKYQAGTDNVYGELLPKFVSRILKKDLRMKCNDIFVDLGSGVGNVVLQAALEVGCESWGCEMMEDYSQVADLQVAEFGARCRLWGLNLGRICLEKGNFLENLGIRKVLRQADAILVNNQVFTPELNEALTNLFLDLQDGCRIVSLKSFVPSDHKISSRNLNSSYNLLSVEKKRYFSNCVSWTNEGGFYYVSVKDSKRITQFLQDQK